MRAKRRFMDGEGEAFVRKLGKAFPGFRIGLSDRARLEITEGGVVRSKPIRLFGPAIHLSWDRQGLVLQHLSNIVVIHWEIFRRVLSGDAAAERFAVDLIAEAIHQKEAEIGLEVGFEPPWRKARIAATSSAYSA